MTANHSSPVAFVCNIVAEPGLAAVLASIVRTCADDVQLLVTLRTRAARTPAKPSITVHLPITSFVEPHNVWRLAFRVACFCPDVRVSVLAQATVSPDQAADDCAA